MINSTFNKTPDTNKVFAQFKKDTQTLKNNVEVQQNSNTLQQDAFEKKDKKKIARNAAIGLGVMALAYSAFALVKHKNVGGSKKIFPRLIEPIKILAARINPNGFRPKNDILENNLDYMTEVGLYIRRLNDKQKKQYIQHLYQNSNFNIEAKQEFERLFNIFLS